MVMTISINLAIKRTRLGLACVPGPASSYSDVIARPPYCSCGPWLWRTRGDVAVLGTVTFARGDNS